MASKFKSPPRHLMIRGSHVTVFPARHLLRTDSAIRQMEWLTGSMVMRPAVLRAPINDSAPNQTQRSVSSG